MILYPKNNPEHAPIAQMWTSLRLPVQWKCEHQDEWQDWDYSDPDAVFIVSKLKSYCQGFSLRLVE